MSRFGSRARRPQRAGTTVGSWPTTSPVSRRAMSSGRPKRAARPNRSDRLRGTVARSSLCSAALVSARVLSWEWCWRSLRSSSRSKTPTMSTSTSLPGRLTRRWSRPSWLQPSRESSSTRLLDSSGAVVAAAISASAPSFAVYVAPERRAHVFERAGEAIAERAEMHAVLEAATEAPPQSLTGRAIGR